MADVADGSDEIVISACLGLSQVRFELCEGHLDRVEVGRVFGQEQEPCTTLFERLCGAQALVDVEIVEDDDVAGAEGRSELCLDVDIERRAVDGALDDPGRYQFMAAQAGDEGLRVPFAERRIGGEPLAA